MTVYMANKNDPHGSTSSQIHRNTCMTEEKKPFLKKTFTGDMPFVRPESSGKNNWDIFFSIFHVFHVYFSCLFSITSSVISCQGEIF